MICSDYVIALFSGFRTNPTPGRKGLNSPDGTFSPHRMTPVGTRTLLGFATACILLAASAMRCPAAAIVGPAYPPLGGVNFGSSGGEAGAPGGVTWYFSNAALAAHDTMYWGPISSLGYPSVMFSLLGNTSDYMHFAGISGNTFYYQGNSGGFNTQCRFVVNGAGIAFNGNVGLNPNLGAVAVVPGTAGWNVNIFVEIWNGSAYVPALPYFDQIHQSNPTGYPQARTEINCGFYYVNSAPTISSIPDQVMQAGTTLSIPFTVGDYETPNPNTLSVFITSAPSSFVQLSGSGTSRTLTIQPPPGWASHSPVTVAVQDQDGASSSTTFSLTIDTPPQISQFSAQTIQLNGSSAPLPFTISDPLVSAGNLVVTPITGNASLVPQGNLIIAGSGASRTLTVSGATGATGSTTVGVRVSGYFTNQSTFNLLINNPPTISGLGGSYVVAPGSSLGPLSFTVGDVETPVSQLSLEAVSDNPGVGILSQVGFGPGGSSSPVRTLSFSAPPQAVGVAHITVVVHDTNGGTNAASFTVTAVSPPAISTIPAQTIQMNSTSGPISFTVSDAFVSPDALILAPVYGDMSLVPEGNITITGTGTSRTLTVWGAPNRSGATTIGVQAYNGYFSSQSLFPLVINSPPTISPIGPNFMVTPGAANGPYPFTIGDAETPGALSLQAFSDNAGVLPANRVNFSLAAGTNAFYLFPLPGTNGVAHITVVVSDINGGTNSTSFTVVSDFPPTISAIPDQVVQMNTISPPISFTVSSGLIPADALVVNGWTADPVLAPLSGFAFGGGGSNRSLTITPPVGGSGTASVGVQVSDGVVTTQTNFSLKINHPPVLQANVPLLVNQAGGARITPGNLNALDPDNAPGEVVFTINPNGTGGPPFAGTLMKSGTPLVTGSTFTMLDVLSGFITYQNSGSCAPTDAFQFGIADTSGGVASDGGHSVYTFHIQVLPVDIAPVAINSIYSLADSASFNGSLTASNGDCRNVVLTYQITTPPAQGVITSFNPTNGAFTYLSTATQPGTDSFTFLVANSGATAGSGSTSPGTVTINSTNAPPKLTFNVLLPVNQCGTALITPSFLAAVDPDNTPAQVIFTINPDGSGGPPHNGTLLRNGSAVGTGGTFTMDDVINGRVAYQNNCACQTNDDFSFGVTDTSGGQANDNGHTSFTFHISIIPTDVPPVANDGTLAVPLGASATGTLTAVNTDCRNLLLRYALATPPAKGTITSLNSTNGTFTYQATAGQTGSDTFTFLVSNYGFSAGSTSSVPGTVTVTLRNTPPTASSTNFMVAENMAYTNTLPATDPDLPAQPLTFTITANGSRGTATLLDPRTGKFVYTPLPNRFGFDSISFQVSDGIVTSAPANLTFNIRVSTLRFGDLVVAEDSLPAVIAFDPASGDAGIVFMGAPLDTPTFLAVEPSGTILITDQSTGLNRVDPRTGLATNLVAGSQVPFALGVALEHSGNILVSAAGGGQISRFSPGGTLLTNFNTAHMTVPAGLAVDSNGEIYCANAGFFGGGTNAVFQIDPFQLQEVGVASISSAVGLTVDPANSVVAANYTGNALVRISFPGGGGVPISSGGFLNQPFGVASDAQGYLYAANGGDGAIIGIDPVTTNQTVIAAAGAVGRPFGITVAGWPIVPPAISNARFTTPGNFQVTITGFPGTPYTLLTSTDPRTPLGSWTVVGPFTETTQGTFVATDPGATGGTHRYYRARH